LIAIQDALKMTKNDSKKEVKNVEVKTKPNPLDLNFDKLKIDMQTLPTSSDEYKMIDKYVQHT